MSLPGWRLSEPFSRKEPHSPCGRAPIGVGIEVMTHIADHDGLPGLARPPVVACDCGGKWLSALFKGEHDLPNQSYRFPAGGCCVSQLVERLLVDGGLIRFVQP